MTVTPLQGFRNLCRYPGVQLSFTPGYIPSRLRRFQGPKQIPEASDFLGVAETKKKWDGTAAALQFT